jgi:hypothetical protein
MQEHCTGVEPVTVRAVLGGRTIHSPVVDCTKSPTAGRN